MKFPSILMVTGADPVRREEIKKDWIESQQGTPEWMDEESFSPQGFRDLTQSLSLFQAQQIVIVVNFHLFPKPFDELMGALVKEKPALLSLLLLGDKCDQRKSWVKSLQAQAGATLDCSLPRRGKWGPWIEERLSRMGKKMTVDAKYFLSEYVGEDPWRLSKEIEKAAIYVGESELIQLKDVETIVSGIPSVQLFRALDILFEKNSYEFLKALQNLLSLGEAPLKLLSLIARHVRLLLHCRALLSLGRRDPSTLASRLGVPPFAVRTYLDQAGRWETAELLKALQILSQCDQSLKGNSQLPPSMVLETAVLEMTQ